MLAFQRRSGGGESLDGKPRPDDVQALARLLNLVYLAMLVSVGCYWLVSEVISSSLPARVLGPEKTVLRIFGLALTVVVLYLRFGRIAELLRPAVPTDFAVRIKKLRASYIGSYIVAETVAVLGLILKILGATPLQVAPFFAVALVLLMLCYPRLPEQVRS
jgi:hypothetical protein